MEKQSRTVLMILYHFPPSASGGTYRPLKFIRYLPDFGWRSVIIAPLENKWDAQDHALLREVPHGTEIYRVFPGAETSWLYSSLRKTGLGTIYERQFIPDRQIGFVHNAIEMGRKIISRCEIDMILTSVPPYSMHIAGRELASEFKIPWVADFRDPWTACPFYKPPTPALDKRFREIENTYFEKASAIIAFPQNRAEIEKKHHPGQSSKILSIENGYDPSDFPSSLPEPPKNEFRIVHVGSITRDRPVTIFLEALRDIITADKNLAKEIRLDFIGPARAPTPDDINRLGLGNITAFKGTIPHRETCAEMSKSNLLFMVLPNLSGAGEIMPLRLFEYIYSRRPVFMITPEGGTTQFFDKSRAGIWTNHSNKSEIASKLAGFINDIRSGKYIHNPDLSVLKNFERKNLTERLAKLFDSIIAGGFPVA